VLRALLLLVLLAGGCARFDPAALPEDEEWLVAVKSCRLPGELPPPVSLAHHAWFDVKQGSEGAWVRIEVMARAAFERRDVIEVRSIGAAQARGSERWDHAVHLHRVVRGPEARRIGEELVRLARGYPDARVYNGWPGPNSNTFVERLGRSVDGLRFQLHHDAVGRSCDGLLRVGLTASGSGVALETPLLGLRVGLEEGLELHLLQLTFGLDLWPPALELPFLPRLGFPATSPF
jgi:hypothetical protein